jgi:hypothetical protein
MKSKLHSFSLNILKGLTASLMLVSPTLAGETTITGQNGGITTVQTDRSKLSNTSTVNRTVTYPNSSTSSSNGSFNNNGDGNYTGTVNRTNRSGQINTYDVNGQVVRNGNSRQNTGTITGTNGKQSTFNNSGSCSNGVCSGNRNLTFSNGQVRNTTFSGQRLDRGTYTGTATFTGRNGNTRSGAFVRRR